MCSWYMAVAVTLFDLCLNDCIFDDIVAKLLAGVLTMLCFVFILIGCYFYGFIGIWVLIRETLVNRLPEWGWVVYC